MADLKILISCSSNKISNDVIEEVLDAFFSDYKNFECKIITGDSEQDRTIREYAKKDDNYHQLKCFSTEWKKYGKSAIFRKIYDEQFFLAQSSDEERKVLLFWDENTKNKIILSHIKLAMQFHNELIVYNYNSRKFLTDIEISNYSRYLILKG